MKESIVSGQLLIITTAAQAAFFLIFESSPPWIKFATSILISRHISGVQTSPTAFKAKAWTSGFSLFCKSFFIVEVANNNTWEVLSITKGKAL